MKLCFLVGSIAISGGTYVILQHASYLQKKGIGVTLAIQEAFTDSTLHWHTAAPQLRCINIEEAKSEYFDLIIATWWKTVFELTNFQAGHYAYFVQSIESRFYPPAELALRTLVDKTYHFPVSYVTEAVWIQQHLLRYHNQDATLVRNGIRKELYSSSGISLEPRSITRKPRVLIEGPFGVFFKNTALAIQLAKKAGFEDIWLLTSSPVRWLPGVNRVFSQVPIAKTAEIYRSCDILIKLSTVEGMFGPPLEMFHCGGTSLVFDVTGHDEYIQDKLNAVVIPKGDTASVIRSLRSLSSNREHLEKLQAGALTTAEEWPSWDASSCQFHKWVNSCLEKPLADRYQLSTMTKEAFADYAKQDAQLHFSKNLKRFMRYKAHALLSTLPPPMIRQLKSIEALCEVSLGSRKVC